MRSAFIALCLLIAPLIGWGQAKINPFLETVIDNPSNAETALQLLVKGDFTSIKSFVQAHDGLFKTGHRPYASIALPAKHVREFATISGLERIEFYDDRPQVLNDLNGGLTNTTPVYAGFPPLMQGYSGKNVVVGIIDTGIELEHPDFWNTDSTTRIYRLWDHNNTSNSVGYIPPAYGYGTVYTNTVIDSGIVPHEDPEAYFGHGTHVTGIAAGNGQTVAQFAGMAPEATLVIVASNFGSFNWRTSVVDGIDYIFAIADSLEMPAVVNVSLGTYNGSHDGRDASTQLIDAMINEKPGRSVISALGNAGEVGNFHLSYPVTSDTSFTWFELYDGSENGGIAASFELWADTGSLENVRFSLGVDLNSPEYVSFGRSDFFALDTVLAVTSYIDTIWNDTNKVGIVEAYGELHEGAYAINVQVKQVDSTNAYVRFSAFGDGQFDVWSTRNKVLGTANMIYEDLPSVETFPDMAYYQSPDKWSSLITGWGCSEHVIGVGNYSGRAQMTDWSGEVQLFEDTVGKLSSTSSYGPTRDRRIKPDIVAPGENVLSTGRIGTLNTAKGAAPWSVDVNGWHNLNSGTSMAAPAVAGAVALLLESCPDLTNAEIRQMLIDGATRDEFTGSAANNRYGYGKLNVFNSMINTSRHFDLNYSGALETCEVVELEVTGEFGAYLWNNGQSSSTIEANQNVDYYASVKDVDGCFGLTDSVQVIIDPYRIDAPILTVEGSLSLCDGESLTLKVLGDYKGYEWSHDDDINAFKIEVDETNYYFVEVTDFDGCRAFSDTVTVSMNPSPPTPSISAGTDSLVSTIANSYQWFINDTIIEGATGKVLSTIMDTGYFKVQTTLANGCSSISEEVFFAPVIPLGLNDVAAISSLEIAPVPFQHQLQFSWDRPGEIHQIAVYNLQGQLIKSYTNLGLTSGLSVNTTDWDPGTYLIRSSGQHAQQRLVVKR